MSMERVKEWLFEPGLVKSTTFGVGGLVATWAAAEVALKAVVLLGTVVLILIHVVNAIVRQWCPLRRQKVRVCDGCPLKGHWLCPKGTERGEEI